MALLYPTRQAAGEMSATAAWQGRALGTYRYWRNTGYAIGGLLLGSLAQWRGKVAIAFWTTAGLLLLSGLWVAVLSEETHPALNPADREGRGR